LGFDPILLCSQSGHNPQQDLANFGYKLHMKDFKEKKPSYFWVPLLEQCIEIW
jgi:hypothetical protein